MLKRKTKVKQKRSWHSAVLMRDKLKMDGYFFYVVSTPHITQTWTHGGQPARLLVSWHTTQTYQQLGKLEKKHKTVGENFSLSSDRIKRGKQFRQTESSIKQQYRAEINEFS